MAMADIIKLNVGGCIYTTSRSTLIRYPNSVLGVMFNGGPHSMPTTKDKDGNYWIDANGDMFKFVLDFLRRGRLLLPELFQEFDLLETEADFYRIPELIQSVAAQRLNKPGNQEKIVGGKKQYIVVEYLRNLQSLPGFKMSVEYIGNFSRGYPLEISEMHISGPAHALEKLRLDICYLHPRVELKTSGPGNIIIYPYDTSTRTSSLSRRALAQMILNLGYEVPKKPEFCNTNAKGKQITHQWFVSKE